MRADEFLELDEQPEVGQQTLSADAFLDAESFLDAGEPADGQQPEQAPDYNMLRGAAERGGQLLGGMFTAGNAAAEAGNESYPLGGLVWEDGLIPDYKGPEEYNRWRAEEGGQEPLKSAAERWTNFDAGYVPNHTWEKLKQEFSEGGPLSGSAWGEVLAYGAEQGIKSTADMAAALVALPNYVLARSGEIGEERARNKGKDEAELVDVAEAAPFALGSAILERIGAKGIVDAGAEEIGKEALKRGLGRIAKEGLKAGGREAATELVQEGVIEYVGEKFGTDAEMSFMEALDRGAAGAVAGGVYGTAAATTSATGREAISVAGQARSGRRQAEAPQQDGAEPQAAAQPETAGSSQPSPRDWTDAVLAEEFLDEPESAAESATVTTPEDQQQTNDDGSPIAAPEQERPASPEPVDALTERGTGVFRVPVDQIKVDPEQYQFRSRVNEQGVDKRLEGVKRWDDKRAGSVLLHRREDGSLYVADGHHRVDLARRLNQGEINATVVDEADGVSVEQARVEAAMNNIADGKAEPIDVAKVFRDSEVPATDVRDTFNLPNSQAVRDGEALSRLSGNVFGMVTAGQMPEKDGAAIGSAFADQAQQEAAADAFQKVQPETEYQRQLLVNEIRAADFAQSQGDQGGLFGDDAQEISLMQDRLKVLDALRQRLNGDKRLFRSLNDNADRASEAGNQIATDANESITQQSARSLDLIGRVTTTPALNEMVNRAARRVYDGENRSKVVSELKKELMSYEAGTNGAISRPGRATQSSEPVAESGQKPRASEPVSEPDTTGEGQGGQSESRQQEVAPALDLESQTEEQLSGQARAREEAEQAETEQRKQAEQRAQADSEANDFTLTGSDSRIDQAEARGQGNMFDAPAEPESKPDQESASLDGDKIREQDGVSYYEVGEDQIALDFDAEPEDDGQTSSLPGGQRGASDAATEADDAGSRSPRIQGQRQRARQIERQSYFHGQREVTSAAEAAHVLAPFRKDAHETMLGLVMDEDRRPLAIIRHTKGTVDGAAVYPEQFISDMVSVPGADSVWLSHNHPSGTMAPSGADIKVTQKLAPMIESANLKLEGHVIIGFGRDHTAFDVSDRSDGGLSITEAAVRKHKIPVLERQIASKTGMKKSKPIKAPDDAVVALKDMAERDQTGVMLLDNAHRPLGFLDLSGYDLESLRDTSAYREVLQALASTNASSGIVQAGSGVSDTQNLQRMLADMGEFRLLDAVHVDIMFERDVDYGSAANMGALEASGAWFSRAGEYLRAPESRAESLTAADARAHVNTLMRDWKDRPPVTVADSISEFPKPLREAIRQAGAEGDMRAVFFADHVYILAPRIPNPHALEEVVLHEVVGHYGLRKMLGNDLKPLLNHVYMRFASTERAKQIIRDYYPNGGFDANNREHRLTVGEELLAHMAESGNHKKLWNRIVSAIREGLRKLGFNLELSETDLLNILRGAQRTVENGGISRPSSADVNFSRSEAAPHFRGTEQASDIEILFHDSPEPEAFTVQENYGSLRQFGGIFAGPNGGMYGEHRHAVVLDPEKTLTISGFQSLDPDDPDVSAALESVMPQLSSEQRAEAWAYIAEEENVFDSEDAALELLGETDVGDASWEAQRLRGQIAKHLGYQSVQMQDETGTSTLVLPGVTTYPLNGEDSRIAEGRIYDEWKEWKSTLESALDPANPDIRFSRSDTAPTKQRQVKFWDGFTTQPLDRMFRALFDVTGLVDSHGRLKPGVKITEGAERILKEWRPNPAGHFTWMDGVLETARHGLIDRYKLTDDYKMAWRQAEAYGRNLDMQAMDILKTLEERGVQGNEAAVLQKILTGETVSDFKMEALATPIRQAIDDLGQAAVEYGIITREQFERNRGEYLHRSYLKHEGEFTGLGKFIHNQQRKQNRKIKGDTAKGRGIQIRVKTDKIMQYVPVGWYGVQKKGRKPDLQALASQRFTILENPGVIADASGTLEGVATADQKRTTETVYWPASQPIPAKYDTWRKRGTFEVRGARGDQVTLWRDYTKAEREHMGEILDARYNIAKTFQMLSRDLAMGKFFTDVAQNPEWFQRAQPVDGSVLSAGEARTLNALSKADWVEVPTTTVSQSAGTKQWGALSGGFVRAEIWRDLNELDKMHNPGMWRKILTQWKLNKALALDTPLPTPTGWTTMGEIREGDTLFDESGQPCAVLEVKEIQYDRPCYEVVFSDGERIVADDDHWWFVVGRNNAKGKVLTTEQIRKTLKEPTRGDNNHAVPVAQPIETPAQNLPIPAYAFGVWLGDGDTAGPRLSIGGDDLHEMIALLEESGVSCTEPSKDKRNNVYALTMRKQPGRCIRGHDNNYRNPVNCGECEREAKRAKLTGEPGSPVTNAGFGARMRDLGVIGNKHIPSQYLRGSIAQRTELLQGVVDSEGCITSNGDCIIVISVERLASDIKELVTSLGYKPTIKKAKSAIAGESKGWHYRIFFRGYKDRPIARLQRKVDRLKPAPAATQRSGRRQIVAINPVKSVPVRCIAVSSESHLYLAGKGMIPTHNTARSPVVHMNNVISNFVLMDLADVRATDLYKGILSYKAKDEHWRAAQEYGAFEGTFINEEIRRQVLDPILDELTKQNMAADTGAEGTVQTLSRMAYTIWTKVKKFDNAMTDFYQIEDELFRMATYMRRLDLGDEPIDAARTAREQFLDYDIRAPWVNMARRTVLPFISYTYRAVPVVAHSIIHRPWKLAKYFTLAYLANTLAYILAPGDEDEERRTMRDDQQGMTWIGTPRMLRMPWMDEYGNPVFMDIRRWIPAGDVFDMNQGNSALPIPAPIQFGGPLLLGFEFALNKQAFTGEEIVSRDTDTTAEAAGKTADWLYKSWMPSAAYIPGSYYWEKFWKASDGARDILGRPYSVPQALLSSIGIKVQPHDVKLGYEFRSRDLASQARIIKADMRRAESDKERGIITQGEYLKIRARAKRKMLKLKEQADKLSGRD